MAELRIIAPAIGRSICLEPVARRGDGESDRRAIPFTRIAIVGRRPDRRLDRARGQRRWPAVAIVARRSRADVARAPRAQLRVVDDAAARTSASSAGADLVVLAAPVLQNIAALHELPRARPAVPSSPMSAARSGRSSRPPRALPAGCRSSAAIRSPAPRRRRRGGAPGPVRRPSVDSDAGPAGIDAALDAAERVRHGLRRGAAADRRRRSTIGSSPTSATCRSSPPAR